MADDRLSSSIVYRVQGMENVATRRDVVYRQDDGVKLLMDLYTPPGSSPGSRLPAVFFIHGGPIAPDMPPATRWGIFKSYGALVAASGMIGVTFNHRLHSPTDYGRSESDIIAAINHVRDHANELGVDPARIALWVFSGGGTQVSWMLRQRPEFVRCLVAFYALLDLRHLVPPNAGAEMLEGAKAFSPAAYVKQKLAGLPTFIARAGLDQAMINQSIDLFVSEALAANATLDLANHAEGHHSFDMLDDNDRSREIIARALAFVQAHVTSA